MIVDHFENDEDEYGCKFCKRPKVEDDKNTEDVVKVEDDNLEIVKNDTVDLINDKLKYIQVGY